MARSKAKCSVTGCKTSDESVEKCKCACDDGACTRHGHVRCYIDKLLTGEKPRPHFEALDYGIMPSKVACAIKCW